MSEKVSKEEMFSIDLIFGSIEPVETRRFEDGRMVTYSHAIHRDKNGVVIKTTEPTAIGSIGYDNGTPFTEADYSALKAIEA